MVTAEQKEELKKQRQAAAQERAAQARAREKAALIIQCTVRRKLAKAKVSAKRIELKENGEMAKVILAQRRLVWAAERKAVTKAGYPGSLVSARVLERERNKFRMRKSLERRISVQSRPDFFLSSSRTASGRSTPSLSDSRDTSPTGVIQAL